jgi:hypothetical protein
MVETVLFLTRPSLLLFLFSQSAFAAIKVFSKPLFRCSKPDFVHKTDLVSERVFPASAKAFSPNMLLLSSLRTSFFVHETAAPRIIFFFLR